MPMLWNLRAIATAVSLPILVAGCASVTKETAEEILAKASLAAAPDGAMKNVKTMVLTAKTVTPNGLPGRMTIRLRLPDTIRLETETADHTVIKAFNGQKGWEYTLRTGLRHLVGKELDDLRFKAVLYISPNDNLKDIFAKAALCGSARVDGSDCYKIVGDPLPAFNATPVTLYIDKSTYLLAKSEQSYTTLHGAFWIRMSFQKYKSIEGVMMPRRIISEIDNQTTTIDVESIMWNVPTADDVFNPIDKLQKK